MYLLSFKIFDVDKIPTQLSILHIQVWSSAKSTVIKLKPAGKMRWLFGCPDNRPLVTMPLGSKLIIDRGGCLVIDEIDKWFWSSNRIKQVLNFALARITEVGLPWRLSLQYNSSSNLFSTVKSIFSNFHWSCLYLRFDQHFQLY